MSLSPAPQQGPESRRTKDDLQGHPCLMPVPAGVSAQALPIKMALVFLVTFYSIKLHLVLINRFTLLLAKTFLWLPVVPRIRCEVLPMAFKAHELLSFPPAPFQAGAYSLTRLGLPGLIPPSSNICSCFLPTYRTRHMLFHLFVQRIPAPTSGLSSNAASSKQTPLNSPQSKLFPFSSFLQVFEKQTYQYACVYTSELNVFSLPTTS